MKWKPGGPSHIPFTLPKRGVRTAKVPHASESAEQSSVVEWFRTQYPRHTILAIPNGAHLAGDARRRAIAMARMKREGLEPGTADLFIAVPKGLIGFSTIQGDPPVNRPLFSVGGLWVEMKALDGDKPTDAQQEFGRKMSVAGYTWRCCRGAGEAIAVIKSYMENA